MIIGAVIFDLDGLVLDSETTYISAWQKAASDMGYSLDEAFCRSLSGLHGISVETRLLEQLGEDFDINRFRDLSGAVWLSQVQGHGIPVKKGFFALLNLIESRELPFTLATNSRRNEAERCLELAGLGRVFPHIVARDDVLRGKPSPDLFIAAAAGVGVSIGHCLVLEDSAVGVSAAVSAGAPCIYVPSVYPLDDKAASSAIAVLSDLDQVASFIMANRF